MIRFQCDYGEGAHPSILKRLEETNMVQTAGYGEDPYCEAAREKIRELCKAPEADVQFLVGGTQTNFTVISSILRPHQGVLAAHTGHINVHETGAIEATGHKVLPLPSEDGTICAAQVREAYETHWNDENHEHVVQPGMVYISHPTENGTLYSKAQLTELSQVCRELGLPLYLDGARLGYGLTAQTADLTMEDVARLTDVFYIGGTKVGALFGEAVVFPRPGIVKQFFTIVKRHGALLAKGRLLGIQFDTLFTDGLYLDISRHAIKMAARLRQALTERGYTFFIRPQTNQLFVSLPMEKVDELSRKVRFSVWEKHENHTAVVRFATSWATRPKDIDELISLL